jgi:hypothetical protein
LYFNKNNIIISNKMYEHQILARIKPTKIKTGRRGYQYGKCQICSENYSQQCVEASNNNKTTENIVFILCKDCCAAVNDICTTFVYEKKTYNFETFYNINDKPIRKLKLYSVSYKIPFVIGSKVMF